MPLSWEGSDGPDVPTRGSKWKTCPVCEKRYILSFSTMCWECRKNGQPTYTPRTQAVNESKHVDYASALDGVTLSLSCEPKAGRSFMWMQKEGKLQSFTFSLPFFELYMAGAREFYLDGRWTQVEYDGLKGYYVPRNVDNGGAHG